MKFLDELKELGWEKFEIDTFKSIKNGLYGFVISGFNNKKGLYQTIAISKPDFVLEETAGGIGLINLLYG